MCVSVNDFDFHQGGGGKSVTMIVNTKFDYLVKTDEPKIYS